ncbi:MAG: DUF5343 domain-containing protein [Chloroflexia bacterium]
MFAYDSVQRAPYSRPNPVLAILRRNHDKGVPNPLTATNLERLGLLSSSGSHALQAIKFLGLVLDDGSHTETFDRMRRVGDEEYRSLLAQAIQMAYKPVFEVADPSTDNRDAIDNAFRLYDPPTQRTRMVLLFLELCREAGLAPPEEELARRSAGAAPKSKQQRRIRPAKGKESTNERKASNEDASNTSGYLANIGLSNPNYVVLAAMFQRLPASGKWTEAERERWLTTLEANLDFSIEIIPDVAPKQDIE